MKHSWLSESRYQVQKKKDYGKIGSLNMDLGEVWMIERLSRKNVDDGKI